MSEQLINYSINAVIAIAMLKQAVLRVNLYKKTLNQNKKFQIYFY